MLLSKNWLRDFVFLPDAFEAEKLAAQLSLATVEVEKIKKQGEFLDGVVVGEILEAKKHPDAIKLNVAQVDVGESRPRQIVFGQMAKMEPGLKVPVALAPTVLPGNKAINKVKMRGEVSEGMLCLDQELGLLDEGVSIHFFDKKVKNGTPLIKALGLDDVIFDIDNKSLSNRPDLWGHYGMAREIAALTRKKFKELAPPKIKAGREKISVTVREPKLCPRYMAVAMSGVSATTLAPDWMVRRLEAAGMRSINAIVDVTNYVMIELGQPLHAFGSDVRNQISDIRDLVVRRAHEGEKFTTLDDKTYTLTLDMLVIADNTRALALAGIKGGKNSGVTETTTAIVLEAATFDGANIRRTSNAVGVRTDSSARFEKSLDPHLPELALRRAVELLKEIFPKSQVTSEVVDVKNFSDEPKILTFPWSFINERLGVEIPRKVAVDILERLGFHLQIKKGMATVTVPTWRATKDITIPEDLVEEVVRVYGYANVTASLPIFPITPPAPNPLRRLEREVRTILARETGLTEVYNYSFVAPEWLRALGLEQETYWELDNPVAKDRPLLRRALVPGLIENITNNLHWSDAIRLFEIGRVFRSEESGDRAKPSSSELLPQQPICLALAIAEKNNETPFFAAAQCVRVLGERLGYAFTLTPTQNNANAHPGRQAEIKIGEHVVGTIVEVHPRLQQQLGILPRVAVVELVLSDLLAWPRQLVAYHSVSEFPSVSRDMACVVAREVTHAALAAAIQAVDPLIVSVELFDVYVGEHVGADQKSMAYHVVYQTADHTLTTAEVDAAHARVGAVLKKKFAATIR